MRRAFRFWIFLCILIKINVGRYDRKKSFSYQFFRRDYNEFDRPFFDFYDGPEEDPGNRWLCVVLGLCTTSWFHDVEAQTPGITPVYSWGQLEFDYATEAERQSAIDSGEFIEGNPAPIDVDIHYSTNDKNKIFLSIPRFQDGMPVTLGTVTERLYKGNQIIAPFPSWSWHKNPRSCKPNRLISVFRVKIDECGHLWVLDTGRVGDETICPPQIIAFNIQTNEVIHRYEVPADQYHSTSIFVTLMVDVRDPTGSCRDVFIYVADVQGFGLIVYDANQKTSWRVVDKTMYPFPSFGTFHVAGDHFDLMDGILGMALSPYVPGQDRVLFYHALSSNVENWVYTSDLRNHSTFMLNPSPNPDIFHTYPGKRPSQAAGMAIDKNGIAYFGLTREITINCWNTATDYGKDNIGVIAENKDTMQFVSSVKVIKNKRNVDELWFLSMRFQKIATGTLDTSETNFRIQAAKVDDLIKGSKCLSKPTSQPITGGSSGYRPVYGSYNNRKPSYKRNTDSSVHFPSE